MVLSYLTIAQTKWGLRVDEGHSGFKTVLMSAVLVRIEIKRAFYLFERSWTGELAQLVNWLSSDSLYPRKKNRVWLWSSANSTMEKQRKVQSGVCLVRDAVWKIKVSDTREKGRFHLWIAHAFAHNCMCTQTYLYMHTHGRCVNKHLNKETIRNNEGKKWERRKENRIISPIFPRSSHHCLCVLYCYQLRQFCFHVCNGAGTNYLVFSKSTSGCMSTAC